MSSFSRSPYSRYKFVEHFDRVYANMDEMAISQLYSGEAALYAFYQTAKTQMMNTETELQIQLYKAQSSEESILTLYDGFKLTPLALKTGVTVAIMRPVLINQRQTIQLLKEEVKVQAQLSARLITKIPDLVFRLTQFLN